MSRYDDIINHPRHVSSEHPPMSMHDRAAQFAPFAALTGYNDVVAETARLTEEPPELDEQEKILLNRRLNQLIALLPDPPEAKITYFIPDQRKSGGRIVTIYSRLKNFSPRQKTITLQDEIIIPIDQIIELEGVCIEANDLREND